MSEQIEFGTIVIRGFRSITETLKFKFSSKGIFVIQAPNGAGKTTLIEALAYVLYGINLKEENQDAILTYDYMQPPDYDGAVVILSLKKGADKYVILRSHKSTEYPGFLVRKNGIEEPLKGKEDAPAYMRELLGVSSDVFLNSILFGQRLGRLVQASEADKREIFEEIFEVDFTEAAKAKADEHRKQLASEIDDYDASINRNLDKVKNLEEQLNTAQENSETFEIERAENIQTLTLHRVELETNLNTKQAAHADAEIHLNKLLVERDQHKIQYEKAQQEYEPLNKAYNDAKVNCSNLAYKATRKEQEIAQMGFDESSTKCSKCGVKLKPTEIKKLKAESEQEILRAKEVLKLLESDLTTAQKDLELAESKLIGKEEQEFFYKAWLQSLESYDDYRLNTVYELKQQAITLEANIQGVEKQLAIYKGQKNPYSEDMQKALTLEIDGLTDECIMLTDSSRGLRTLHDNYQWWSKTGFSNSGLKAYVFNQMLRTVNVYLQSTSQRFGIGVELSVDLTKARKVFKIRCKHKGHEVNYSSLSGGEKTRVDLSIAFAVHKTLSAIRQHFSVLFFDEFFEGLDEQGMYDAFGAIRELSQTAGVYIISHSANFDNFEVNKIDYEQIRLIEA